MNTKLAVFTYRITAVVILSTVFWAANSMDKLWEEPRRSEVKVKPNPTFVEPEDEVEVEPVIVENKIIETENLVLPADTTDLPWPNSDNPYPTENQGGVSLPLPDNITYSMEYDPETGEYQIFQTIGGDLNYRMPSQMTLEEYMDYQLQGNISEYWNKLQEEEDEEERGLEPALGMEVKGLDQIFGSDVIEIRPQGSAEVTFGMNISKTDNPRIPERQRRISTFDFGQKIQLNVTGNIGTKMQLNTNFNTEATFDFENQMKLEYTGEEDEIIKKIEAGNVSLPLRGTLISGSQNVFGLKIETQWGKLRNTTVASQQKSERKEIEVEGGAQTQTFEISADNYDVNRHFFLSNWFRGQYDKNMESLPQINSGINITRMEVWIVNRQANTQDVRNVIAFTDLGEADAYISEDLNLTGDVADGNPANGNNTIYQTMVDNPTVMGFTNAVTEISAMPEGYDQGIHYERIGNARMLNASEYTYNARLGFLSLRQSLNNDEVLAVSYEYTYNGQNFKVGTMSQDGFASPDALILKMLKASITNVESPIWDLMMKNVYNIGAFGLQRENFRLDVWYNNPATGVDQNFVARDPLDGVLLIQVLDADRLDLNSFPNPDGLFDYIDNAATIGGLVNSQNGRIFLPNVEPFGSHLEKEILERATNPDEAQQLINDIVFNELYDNTKTFAQQIPSKNRFKLRGQYQSSSGSEINLNSFNIPQGSVVVTAGGVRLIENQDYTVDYNLGRVRITNEGILQAGTPIKISLESNALFSFQNKTLIGSRFDYDVNDDLQVGATIINMRERPLTQKVNIGDEPVNNTQIGVDFAYQKEAPWLTRLVDKIPLIDTKEASSVDANFEAARFFPGYSKAIGEAGNAYLDDFEGSQSVIDIRNVNQWFMASTPKLQEDLFPEGILEDDLRYNYNRAKLSWYTVDPSVFFRANPGLTPESITDDVRSDHRMREILEAEVFPSRELAPGTPTNIATLDLTYYPDERGMYNYERPNGSEFSDGFDVNTGLLNNPRSRWAGIQRALTTTDFETSNIEFIQFWVMDPFNSDSENINGGDLYFDLGNVSEDVLNDSQLSFENGLPTENQPDLPTGVSTWGIYPTSFNVVNAFDNLSGNYFQQDIGLDGLNSQEEQSFFADFLAEVQAAGAAPEVYNALFEDPSSDDYRYSRGDYADALGLNTLERYRDWNNNEGNSDISAPGGIVITATTIPNTEDINQDITLNTIESYFQYKVSLRPSDLGEFNVGSNYITSTLEQEIDNLPNGETKSVRWYQFRIPIRDFESRVGSIADFRSIRFIRMFMKGWEEEVTLRFARLELVRGEWRQYLESLEGAGEDDFDDPDPTTFNIGAVNIEENSDREPVNYVIPPGIIREVDLASTNGRQINEQSLSLEVCNLVDGDARAAYRNVNFDMRLYENLEMYVHAEAAGMMDLNDDDISCFIRLGSDFNENYYEYEIPLKVTDDGASDPNQIWPEDNIMRIDLSKFQDIKIRRSDFVSSLVEFTDPDDPRFKIKGNPNLANVVTVMVGIRNLDKDDNPFSSDDGLSKCAVVWVNELRLTGINREGGWAALGRVNANLADFGTMQVAGSISTPGWGGIEESVQDVQRELIVGFDANSTLQLGKFFPEHLNVQLPLFMGYSETVVTPQFDPLFPDIELNDQDLSPQRKKKSQNFTKIRSINITNAKIAPEKKPKAPKDDKGKGKGDGKDDGKGGKGKDDKGKGGKTKTPFYSISNFSFSYGYTETYRRDINTEFNIQKNYNGGINYNFNNKIKEVKPFAKVPVIKDSKYLKWIKDFNFYPGIKSFSFRTNMNRFIETSRLRDNTFELFGIDTDALIQTQVQKTWDWSRQYALKYDITKSLKFDYSANNLGLVRERPGLLDRENPDSLQVFRDEVLGSIQSFGQTTNYDHSVNLTYKVPLDKFPLIDFMSLDTRYSGTFRWDIAPFAQDTLGNTIQNSRMISITPQANFLTLYNKVPLLKKINSGKPGIKGRKGKLSNEDVDGFGEEIDKKEKKDKINIGHEILRFLMMVKSVSGSYSQNEGTLLPGYRPSTNVVGFDNAFNGPGIGFLAGHQYDLSPDQDLGEQLSGYALYAERNGWLYQHSDTQASFPTLYSETFSQSWSARAKLEPIKHFDIELTMNRQESQNYTSFITYDEIQERFIPTSQNSVGTFTGSTITWATAFVDDREDFSNEIFDTFLANRAQASREVSSEFFPEFEVAEGEEYAFGWNETSQEVVMASFIAAYTGTDVKDVNWNPFKTKILPNWDVKYDGLSRNDKMKKYFKRFSIDHAYQSTISTSYLTNLSYEQAAGTDPDQGVPSTLNEAGNYITQRQFSTVTITESFAPLVGFDMTLNTKNKNEPMLRIEYKKERNIALGLANFQITETKSNAIIFGAGYKITEVPNPFGRAKKSRLPVTFFKQSDLTLRADLTIRDNVTIIRRMVEDQNQVTAGQKLISIKTSADMNLTKNLTIRFFYDHQLTRPKISTSFPTSNISTGLSLRFQLS